MKAVDLVVNQKYWCGWASRFGWFVKIREFQWCGEKVRKAVFRDICDCIIECEIDSVEKWVLTCEEFKQITAPLAR